MIDLLLCMALATSPTEKTEAVERCKSAAREHPGDYETVICLNRLRVEPFLEIVSQIESENPDNPYVELLRGNHFFSNGHAEKSVPHYRNAVEQLSSHGDETRAILAQSNLSQALFWGTDHIEETEKAIDKLQQMYLKSTDPAVHQLGIVHWSSLAADRDKNVGLAYDAISRIPQKAVSSMSSGEQRKFYYARGRLAGLMLRFDAAKRDFQELGRHALEQEPPARKRHAVAINDAVAFELRGLQLRPQDLQRRSKALAKELEQGIEAANSVGRTDVVATSLYSLATVYFGTEAPREKILQAINRCLAISATSREQSVEHARCLTAKSQLLELTEPRQAYEVAHQALAVLDNQGQQELRLVGWRNLMRRAWSALSQDEAVAIAMHALDEIEGLRSHQRNKTARQLMFSVWNEDYSWIASRLLKVAKKDHTYLETVLQILERSRARVLLEYMPEPEANEPDTQGESSQSELNNSTQNTTFATLPELQAKLEPDEAMLVYQIANQKALNGEVIGGSWVLLITKDSAEPIKLPLERFQLANSVSIVRDMARYDDSAMHLALDGLGEKLLAPATDKLSEKIRNLIIVADGPLHALPFFSINPNYNYTLTPSATIWSKTRVETSKLQLMPSGMSVVDPERKAAASTSPQGSPTPGMAIRDAGIDVTQPLHEGRRESKAIQESLTPQLRTLTGSEATTRQLIKGWTADDNILHISAHSQVDTEVPEQSKILLSNLKREELGNLTVSEIYKLPLDNDVVVLAGCSTGWGNWVAGEGILSLARAFQIAGASAIVASLWPIRDNEAADFFEEFYANLGEGQPIAIALSTAQQTLRDRNYPPQAYEGYVVIGDGRIRFASQVPKKPWKGWLLIPLALIPLGVVFALRRRSTHRDQH